MGNKVAISFGVIIAIFIVLALTFWGLSAAKHSRHNTAKHNRLHDLHLDNWIKRKRGDPDVEMHDSVLPRHPENAYTRTGPSRVSRMGRLDRGGRDDRVEFCNVPLDSLPLAPRGDTRPGFF